MHIVFVYGTLRDPKIRRRILGTNPATTPSSLLGFRMSTITLDGVIYPILIEDPGCQEIVNGEYFKVDDKGLLLLDDYESDAYRRKIVTLEDGVQSWVYYT